MGQRRRRAISPGHRSARTVAGDPAAAHRGRARRAPADAPAGAAIPRAWADSRRLPREVRRGCNRGAAAAELGGGGGTAHRARVRRGALHLASLRRAECCDVVRRAWGRRAPALAGRLVVRLREPAAVPVHPRPVVFPNVPLDTLSLAGGAVHAHTCAHTPGSRRRPRVPVEQRGRIRAPSGGSRDITRRGDRQSDLLRGGDAVADKRAAS